MSRCYFCNKYVGKKRDNHHIYGRKRSRKTAVAHKGCHRDYHKKNNVYSIPMPKEAILEELDHMEYEIDEQMKAYYRRLDLLRNSRRE